VTEEGYLEDLGKLLTSDEADELALGLIGATGRRPCEVLLRGDFVTAKESDLTFPQYQPVSHWLKFSGQAKKRRNTAVNYTPIAVLFPADFILKSVKRLRKMPEVATVIKEIAIEVTALELPKLKEQYSGEALEYQVAIKENEYLDNRFGSKQNKLLQTQLKSLDVRHGKNSVSRSSLRAAYARLAVARDCPPGKNDLVWASRLLGHMDEKADLRAVLTTLGYFDYYLEKDAEVPLLDTPKSEITVVFRGYANDVEAVKAFQEKFDITSQPETFRKLWELAQETLQQRERQLYTQETEEMINDELLAKIDEIVEAKVSKALADFNSKPDAMPGTATLKANALNTPTAETLPIETTKVSTLEPINLDETHEAPQNLGITCDYRLSENNKLGRTLAIMGYEIKKSIEIIDEDDEYGVRTTIVNPRDIFDFFRSKCGLVFKANLITATRKNKTTGEQVPVPGLWDIDYKTLVPFLKNGEQLRDMLASEISDTDFKNPQVDMADDE